MLDRLELRDVGRDAEHVAAAARELGHGRVEQRLVDVGEHDAHALGQEPLPEGASDATTAAGHDGRLAPQVLHASTVRASSERRNGPRGVVVDRYVVISADCHAGADLLDYRPYLEAKYHDAFDEWAANFVSPYGDLVRPDADRNWDSTRRMRELEADGVVARDRVSQHDPAVLRPRIAGRHCADG